MSRITEENTPMDSGAFLLLWIVFAGVGAAIGNSKGRMGAGLALGLLLGLIGVIIIAVMSPTLEHQMKQQSMMNPMMRQGYGQPGYPQQGFGQPSGYPPAPPVAVANPAAWHPDPQGLHQLRYWDGAQWTQHVSNNGIQSIG